MLRDLVRRAARSALLFLAACEVGGPNTNSTLLSPSPGLPRFQEPAALEVPGGVVNTAGGNLLLRRVDLSIDTKLGTQEIGAVYNSKTRSWRWTFAPSYADHTFVDATGAVHPYLWQLADGSVIPGSVWIKLDASRIQSLGGLVHEFDPDGRLAAVRWASDPYPRLDHLAQTIAGAVRTTEIRQCGAPGACSPVAHIAYDAEGRVVRISDRAGRAAEFGYDANGWLASARDALDLERGLPGFRYEYFDVHGQLLRARTSSEGERVEYAWHWNQGRITEARAVGAEGAVHRFEYANDRDAYAPHTTVHIDPLGGRTLYRYDSTRRLHRMTSPTGESTVRAWSGFQLSRLTEPGGVTTSWTYVDDDEVIRTEPSGNAVHHVFRIAGAENRADPSRRPIDRIDDSLGPRERRGYDAKGRLAWVENGAGERTAYAWSAENLLASETRPDGVATAYSSYGEHGHAERVAVAGEVATRVFDAVGNPVSSAGLERLDLRPGGEISRRYDGDRNLAELVLADLPLAGAPSEATLRVEWRSDRRVLRIERPGGADHEFDYDALGRLVARRERSGGGWATTLYEVDALGRTVAETLPNGMRRELDFDASGRRVALRALQGGAPAGEIAVAWVDGRPASADDSLAGGAETYAWDAAGRLATVEFPGGERLETLHDLRGRRVRESYRLASGSLLRKIDFTYDGADRPTGIREDGELLVQQTFSAGRLSTTSFGNGLVRSYAYDPATGLLAAATSVGPDGSVVEASALAVEELEAPGEVRVVATTASSGPAAAVTHEEFSLGSLAGEGKRLRAWSDGTGDRLYAADPLANATAAGGDAFVYDAERSRLLARIDAGSGAVLAGYAWDAAGFCVARGGVALRWTALGQIAAIGSEASFEWDLQGRPLRRILAGEEVRFRFGGRVETDAADVPRRLDLGPVALRLDTGEHRYRHVDFRGNVKLESDDAGAAALHLRYGPYGIDASFGAGDGAATFAGGRDLGGLVLIGARVLDPEAARFLSPDPVFQLANQYAYALANPVSFWDPDGREIKPVGFLYGFLATIGGAAGGAAVGGGLLGSIVGGPPGALIGIAVAEAIYQHVYPGQHLFTMRDALEAVAPLYVDPPDGSDTGGRPEAFWRTHARRGGRGNPDGGGPAGSPEPRSCECGASGLGVRFSAFGAFGVSGGVGGGWSGF